MARRARGLKFALTPLERRMLEQGWVSARMLAWKLKCHVMTVYRMGEKVQPGARVRVGRAKFYAQKAIAALHDTQTRALLGLDDWSEFQ